MTLTTGHVDSYDTDITITDHVRCHHTRHDHRLDHGSMLHVCMVVTTYVSLMKGNVHMYMWPGAWCQSWAGTWHREHKQCATEE